MSTSPLYASDCVPLRNEERTTLCVTSTTTVSVEYAIFSPRRIFSELDSHTHILKKGCASTNTRRELRHTRTLSTAGTYSKKYSHCVGIHAAGSIWREEVFYRTQLRQGEGRNICVCSATVFKCTEQGVLVLIVYLFKNPLPRSIQVLVNVHTHSDILTHFLFGGFESISFICS